MTTPVFFVAGLALLYLGGEGLVRSAAAIGVRLGMSPLIAGLTIVAFATSAPELTISLDAALTGVPGLAVGNVVGSNICNIALILGITALVRPASLRGQLIRRDVLVMVLSTLLVPGFLLDGELSRIEGALLVVSIAIYIFLTVWTARKTPSHVAAANSKVPVLSRSIWINFLLAAGALTMLILGSDLLVTASVAIAVAIGVPSAVIGLSAAAFGTSLPELTASIVAARHGHPEMAAGNLIGSNIFNLLMILGVTSVITPLGRGGVTLLDLTVMVVVSLFALTLMVTKNRIERVEGLALITIYALYMMWLFVKGAF